MVRVNPEILIWARETAGLSIAAAAKALSLGGKRMSGEQALTSYEKGEKELTRPLLLKMAGVYRRPLLIFYLPKPPAEADQGEDFRTLPEHLKIDNKGTLNALVRDIHVRKELIKNALIDIEEAIPHKFVGSISIDMPVPDAAALLSKAIGLDLKKFRKKARPEDAFTYVRELVENAGVFVLLIGNLGSHHTEIPVEVFRGFALADEVAPFIVINDQDAPAARSFTLLHELAHIFLGATGISGSDTHTKIERYCNDVSSMILLPANELAEQSWEYDDIKELAQSVMGYARSLNVSGSLVAYRLLCSGVLDEPLWAELSAEFRALWLKHRAAKKEERRSDSGPSYYVVKRHKLGNALVTLVNRTMQEGSLTATKAGKVLGVKPANVYNLVGA